MKNTCEIVSGTPAPDDSDVVEDIGSEIELRVLSFDASHHGMRIDRALVDLVPEFSRSYLQQLIDLGGVLVNGQPVTKASAKVKAFDKGSIELRPTPQSQAFKAEQIPIDVVYQDDHVLVINKPAGWVVHPAPGNWSGTLMNALLGFDPQAFNLPRAGIVHRLDKDTSGLMVVARHRAAMDVLVQAIAARDVKRQYLALGHKPWTGATSRQVDTAIGRDPVNRLRMAVVDLATHGGKAAKTDFELLSGNELGCLVKCTLHTGRTHQIRVHMASLGHSLVADGVYGGALAAGLNRQALHAAKLGFVHPVSGERLVFHAKLPRDMEDALNCWGLKYNASNF